MANGMIRELRIMSEEDVPTKAKVNLMLAAFADSLENQEKAEEKHDADIDEINKRLDTVEKWDSRIKVILMLILGRFGLDSWIK